MRKNLEKDPKYYNESRYRSGWSRGLSIATDERVAKLQVKAQLRVAEVFRNKNYISSLDEKLYKTLSDLKYCYYPQKSIIIDNKYVTTVDAFINPNICIYADGIYWHSLSKVKKRDKFFTKKLKSLGYKVLRIKEEEIHNRCEEIISKYLQDNTEGRLVKKREPVETTRSTL